MIDLIGTADVQESAILRASSISAFERMDTHRFSEVLSCRDGDTPTLGGGRTLVA
jgi:hypothetical protein